MAQTIVQVWVAPTGSDTASGEEDAPYATLASALEHVRELRKNNAPDELDEVQIVMRGGTYRIGSTMVTRVQLILMVRLLSASSSKDGEVVTIQSVTVLSSRLSRLSLLVLMFSLLITTQQTREELRRQQPDSISSLTKKVVRSSLLKLQQATVLLSTSS